MNYQAKAKKHFLESYEQYAKTIQNRSQNQTTKTSELSKEDTAKLKSRLFEQSVFVSRYQGEGSAAFVYLIDNYDHICYNLCAREGMQDECFWDNLNEISLLFRIFPQCLVSLSKMFEIDEKWVKLANHKQLVNNVESIKNAFGYVPELGKTLDGKFRYLVNMPAEVVIAYLDKTRDLTLDETANSRIFMEMAHQSRWGNLWLQIISALLWQDTITEEDAWRHAKLEARRAPRKAYELVTIQAILALISRFDILPFYIRSDGRLQLERANKVPWGTSMVPLLYSLLELSKEEKGCNLTKEAAEIMVTYRFEAAQTSLENVMLDEKSVYTDILKYITFKCKRVIKISRERDYTSPRVYDGQILESEAYPGEEAYLDNEIKKNCYPAWLDYTNRFIKSCQTSDKVANTERVRLLMVMCQIFGNPGIYYKTSLVLEAVKSIEAQIKNILNIPKPKSFITYEGMDIPLEYDWEAGDEIWKLVADEYSHRIQEVEHVLHRRDFTEWYVSLLTNRSQGNKVELGDLLPMDRMSEKGKLILSVAQARIAAFLLDLPTYYVTIKFLTALKTSGMCTTRFQNNRRARIVEIVPNVDQTAYAIVLRVFNETKKLYEDVAVGKQEGGIYDMALQLMVTGNPYAISIFSDISAMDASTQPFIAAMFPQLLAEYINRNQLGPDKYFGFSKTKFDVKITNQQGPSTLELRPLSQNLLLVLSQRLAKKYLLKDNIFGTTIEINPGIFESGRFDTSAQHTTLLSILARIAIRKIRNKHGGLTAEFILRKFGDDSYDAMMNSGFMGSEALLQEYIDYTTDFLHRTGFEVETQVSRMMGDFLQQLAYNGVQIPKSARSSVYCDERGNTAVRDPVAQIKVVADVFSAASQRVYAPENVQSIVRSAWEMIRTIRLVTNTNASIGPRWMRYVKQLGKRSYFQFPTIMISLPPLNFPNLNFKINDIVYPYSSLLRTVGDAKFVWLLNFGLNSDDKIELMAVERDSIGRIKSQDPYQLFKIRQTNPLLLDCVTMGAFNRASILSKKRTELLSDEIDSMARTMSTFYNQERIVTSIMAWQKLRREYGITVPEHISYWSQPIAKIKDMFSAITESVLDVVEINDDFVRYLSKYKRDDPKEIRDKFLTSCFIITPSNEPNLEEYNPLPLPIIPGYREYSDYCYYDQMAGSPLLDRGKVSKAARIFESKYGQNFDLETALREGVKAYARGPSAFTFFMDALSLPPDVRIDFQQAIVSGALALSDLAYHTGFQRDIQFAISGNVERLSRYFNVPVAPSNSLKRTMRLVLRDFMMLTVHMNAFKTLTIQPAVLTEGFYEKRKFLRRIGVDSIQV